MITFPPNPSNGDIHTEGNLSWRYNQAFNAWEGIATAPSHKSSHAAGGSDTLTPADIGAAADSAVVHLTGNETVAGNKTITGQTEMPNQAATNPGSAMTRQLVDDSFLFNPAIRSYIPTAGSTQGTGSYSAAGVNAATIYLGATHASSFASTLYELNLWNNANLTWSTMNHTKPVAFRFPVVMGPLDPKRNTVFRFYIGIPHIQTYFSFPYAGSDPMPNYLRGYGFEMRRKGASGDSTQEHELRLFARDGYSLTPSYTSVTSTIGSPVLTNVHTTTVAEIAAALAAGRVVGLPVQFATFGFTSGVTVLSATGSTVTMSENATIAAVANPTSFFDAGTHIASAWASLSDGIATSDRFYDFVLTHDGTGNLKLWGTFWHNGSGVAVPTRHAETPLITLAGTGVPTGFKSSLTFSSGVRALLISNNVDIPTSTNSNYVICRPCTVRG